MSSDICEKCGMSLDLCHCKSPLSEEESTVEDGQVRCTNCNELFTPQFGEALCRKCAPTLEQPEGTDGALEPVPESEVTIGEGESSLPVEATDPDKLMPESKQEVQGSYELVCAKCGGVGKATPFGIFCETCRPDLATPPVVGHPDPVPENVEVSVTVNDKPVDTFSVIPKIAEPEPEAPEMVSLKLKNTTLDDNAPASAYVAEFIKNPVTQEVLLRGRNNESGKAVSIYIPDEIVQKLIRELMPVEEKRMQVLLDRMHTIRETRGLAVEKLDKELVEMMKGVEKKFDACKTGTDVKKIEAFVRAQLAVINQRRFLAKFSMHEESELGLQLAKLRHSAE